MSKKLCFLLLVGLPIALASAAESTNRLHFPMAGFTIAPLDTPPGETPHQALMMFLPAADGFAANVNVQIQPYTGTIDDYLELSLKQFKNAELKVVQQKTTSKSVAIFEYTGKMQGLALHWYARAEKSGGSVYLVTASALPSQWSKEAARLKSCVDSFRCDGGEQRASLGPAPPRR